MNSCFATLLVLTGTVALPACGFAQEASEPDEPTVEPDRRDFTRGASVVPLGHVQVETGLMVTRSGNRREYLLGDTQIRVPVSRSAEVRLDVPPYRVERDNGRQRGVDDSGIEARLVLSKGKKVTTALTAFSTLPTGARRVAEHRFQPGAVVAANFTLSSHSNLILNLGGERPTNEGRRFSRLLASAAYRFDASLRVNLFSEVYYLSRDEPGGPSQKFADVGAVYFAGKRTAFDGRFGVGLGNRAGGPDYFYSVGVSRLF